MNTFLRTGVDAVVVSAFPVLADDAPVNVVSVLPPAPVPDKQKVTIMDSNLNNGAAVFNNNSGSQNNNIMSVPNTVHEQGKGNERGKLHDLIHTTLEKWLPDGMDKYVPLIEGLGLAGAGIAVGTIVYKRFLKRYSKA